MATRRAHTACIAGFLALALTVSGLAAYPAAAQPGREVRGVWLTTLLGLDWPAASERGNVQAQQASLRRIVEGCAEMNLNTIFFQVRSRGNAFYRSSHEPWAAELTGTLGKDPGWDPLEFLIRECHARGMEVHAWVNLCKVYQGGGSPPLVRPGHIVRQHPEWVEKYNDEYWLDPGIPEARDYTVTVMSEMAKNYDIDGIHLDYARYPEQDFNDSRTYERYGKGAAKEEWRRQNMNALVKLVYDRCTAVRPWLKVGSAPIGIYKSLPTAHGWEGYVRLGQDSRRWLRDGYQDYVVPQIYWGLRNRGSNIDFEALVRDWKTNASGRHVYAGIAAYRPEVAKWLHEHIDVARTERADGEVYFRYAFLENGQLFRGRYATKAIPPPMTWRDNSPPPAPMQFSVVPQASGMALQWLPAEGEAPRRYVVYRSQAGPADINDPAQILAVLPAEATAYTDTRGTGASQYAVTALDAMNNESAAAQPGAPAIATKTTTAALPKPARNTAGLSAPLEYGNDLILVGYNVPLGGKVRLRMLDEDGNELYVLVNEYKNPGAYIIGLERDRMTDAIAVCVLETGGERIERNIEH